MAPSWLRVAAGLQLVAERAAKVGSERAAAAAGRAVRHGCEAASAASASLASSSGSLSGSSRPSFRRRRRGDFNGAEQQEQEATAQQHPAVVAPARSGDASPAADRQTTHTSTGTTHRALPSDSNTKAPPLAATEPSLSFATASVASSQHPTSTRTSPPEAAPAPARSPDPPLPLPPISPPPPPLSTSDGGASSASPEPLRHLEEGRAVPSTRIGRAAGFAQLGVGLALGAAVEGVSRLLGSQTASRGSAEGTATPTSILVNEANSDRLAESLCRMRGAALKMGQMLSIQDETLMPPALQRALVRVRQGAEAMPRTQLERQMADQLGPDWRGRFVAFDDLPFAAASIGQVHRAAVRRADTGELKNVVVKVQYPGVAKSIRSDLRNLSMLVTWTGMAPPGLFIDNVIRVGEQELTVECDYRRELLNQRRIRELVEADPVLRANRFAVPDALPELSTDQILTSEFRPGGTIDKVTNLSQDERNRIGRTIMYLTMKELFVWRFMQTDPNWGNFLYDMGTGTTSLIDFGAAREYSKSFVDGYLRIVWASANRDEGALMEQSYRMNFLTGEENEQMLRAHKLSGYTVGEPFYTDEPFDFRGSNISTRMGEHTSVFLRHRLTPPPEEVYTLHRKLAGAYMLCIKLGAVVECRSLLRDIVANHMFEDGLEPLVL